EAVNLMPEALIIGLHRAGLLQVRQRVLGLVQVEICQSKNEMKTVIPVCSGDIAIPLNGFEYQRAVYFVIGDDSMHLGQGEHVCAIGTSMASDGCSVPVKRTVRVGSQAVCLRCA